MSRYDLAVVGGGSAGFAAAIRAAELGKTVALIEGSTVGGTCVNVGCVPSKTLIRAADTYHRALHHPFRGIRAAGVELDYSEVVAQKDELVEDLRQTKYLDVLGSYPGIRLVRERAMLTGGRNLRAGDEDLEVTKIVVTTGSRPWAPEVDGLAEAGYWTSTEALAARERPESLLVVGGRYVAVELAQTFARFGTRVTVLQRSGHLLPEGEPEIGQELRRHLEAEGLEVHTKVRLLRVARDEDGYAVDAEVDGVRRAFRGERLLVATGRHPNSRGFGLEDAGIELGPRDAIAVNEFLQTTNEHVYAAGDVTGHAQYVYVAAYEGALAAENAILGNTRTLDLRAVPGVTFSDPAVATVGLTEAQARAEGRAVKSAVLPLKFVPRAQVNHDLRGLIKMVVDSSSTEVLGVHVLAADAGEVIQPAVVAVKYGLTLSDFVETFHPYLTMVEGLRLVARSFDVDPNKLSCCA